MNKLNEYFINTYISRLPNFGDFGGYVKDRENISPPILYTDLNRGIVEAQ